MSVTLFGFGRLATYLLVYQFTRKPIRRSQQAGLQCTVHLGRAVHDQFGNFSDVADATALGARIISKLIESLLLSSRNLLRAPKTPSPPSSP